MKVKLVPAVLIITCHISHATGQTGQSGKPEYTPLSVMDIMKVLTVTQHSTITDNEAIQFLIELVRKRCVDFDDDGTNHWVLKMAGPTDELMIEIEKCRSIERKKVALVGRLPLDKAQTQLQQQRLISELFHLLFRKKDLTSRRNAIAAGKEFLRRYDGDPSTVELSQYLKKYLPTLEQQLIKAEAGR